MSIIMPSEAKSSPGLSSLSFFSEDASLASERRIGFGKLDTMPDHHGHATGKSVAVLPLENLGAVGCQTAKSLGLHHSFLVRDQKLNHSLIRQAAGTGMAMSQSSTLLRPVVHETRSSFNGQSASCFPEGGKVDMIATQYENSLFSSSLSDLFSRQVRLSSSNIPHVHSVGTIASHFEDGEPFESLEEIEAQTIGNLLPSDDDLFRGITDKLDNVNQSNSKDDMEELDFFNSVGGLDLGDDRPATQNDIEFPGAFSNGQPGLSNGSKAGQHPHGEHPSRTLFVRNLDSNVEDSELRALFEQYGDIHTLYTSCKHRGFVMISYYDIRAARIAMKALQDRTLGHRKLDIHYSIPKDNPSDKDINKGTLIAFNLDSSISNDELHQIFGVYGQQETKEELLKKNQDRRKARENERLKEKSAIIIQAFYRGRTIAGKLRDNERDSWDQQAKFMLNNAQSERDVAINLINIARSFLFFYRPQHDSQRKLYLYQILWKQIQDSETMFIPFYYDDLRVMWTLQLKRTLIIFLKNIGINIIKPDQYIHNINYLKTVLLPMDVSKYQKIQDTNRMEIYQGIIESLVENGLYIELRNCLINLQVEDKNNHVILLSVTLSLRPFQILPSEHKAYKLSLYNFTTHIFTIPLLSNRMSNETLNKFSSRLPLNEIILKLSEIVGIISDMEQRIVLLGNLLAFAYKNFSMINKLAYMEVLQNLALQIPTHLLVDKSDVSNNDADEDDEDDEDIIMSSRPELANMPKIDPQILEEISVLFDKQHLASFFALMKTANSSALIKISNFFVTLMIRWPTKKIELLNSMIFGIYSASDNRSAITLMWDTFKVTELARLLLNSQSIPNGIMTDTAFSEQWGLFTLLCELFSRVLFTMGDDEFFDESKNPLKLSEIINMSICMKHVGFSLYWSNSTLLKLDSTIEGSLLNNLREIVTKLLRQIHARDSRRQFTPSDHWLMTSEIDMNVFVEAVVREEQELERDNDKIHLNKKQLVNFSPRLGILDNIPFVIPFEVRIKIFREYVYNDKKRDRHFDVFPHPRTRVTIRRNSVFEDGFTHLNALGAGLKSPVAIQFIDEFGMPEAGIDGGGLFKEFLTSLTRVAFDTNYGLFLSTKEQLLYPNPHSYAKQETQLEYYEFIGRILGKALYEGILVDAAFAGFFLSKWLGRSSYLDDLPTLDPELYHGLIYLKNYKGDVESDLSLNFTVVDNEFGESQTIELIPGGSDIPVNNDNRIRYIYMMAHYRLNRQIDRQCKAFFRGLSDLIDEKWLRMFNQEELQILVGGAYIPINIEDLKQNTVYSDYKEDDLVIINFWKVVSEFSEEQKQKLIKFVTSCSRPPILGFKELNPKFSIRNAGSGTRLPSSSTCVNLLKLPAYPDEDTLREKLLYAINADVGFDLS